MEARLFKRGQFPFTPEWYEGRDHAPHREQLPHWHRMVEAARLATVAIEVFDAQSVMDLGAGDGGLLSMIDTPLPTWGYDITESNVRHGRDVRKMDVRHANFLTDDLDWADLVICTEVLEHLEFPHEMVRRIANNATFLVCSSPASETVESHSPEHAWVWDEEGYANLIQRCGFPKIIDHTTIENGDMTFQVILAVQP